MPADPGGTVRRRRRAGLPDSGSGQGSNQRSGRSRRLRRALIVIAALIGVFVLVLAAIVAYAAVTLPDINSIGQQTGTIKILDRNGTLIAEVGHNQETRNDVDISKIAPIMQNATLAAEDRNFYNEGAFDFPRVVKAVIDDIILRRPAEGASTITQQLVKQAFFGQVASKDPLRKIREALLAQQVDGQWSKQKILNVYLNITYYGENAYGVENASERYFGKHASELTVQEAAMIAGLPEAPSFNDPYQNPQAAFARMHYVLTGLVTMGQISQAQANAVDPLAGSAAQQQQNQQALLADLGNGKSIRTQSAAPHFVQYVEDQLQQQFSEDPAFLNGDLSVTTTLDLNLQQQAQAIVAKGVQKIGNGANNGALLMIDPHTGQVLVMVGSADFTNNTIAGQYNITTQATRRPGSSFKPYVYEEGVRTGTVTPETMLQDTKQESDSLGGVQDFDRQYEGNITAAQALLGSRNIATEQAMQMIGINNVIGFAQQLGITTPLAPNLSTAIGSSAVRMVDMASAYAAFANGGQKVTAYGILKVVDGQGNTVIDNSHPAFQEQVMTAANAWTITNILRGYAQHWGLPIKWDTAGKSGTTDQFVDAWYMCYTPSWVVATWAGHTDENNPAEIPMDGVFGTTEARFIAVPFVDSLPKPEAFTPVNGVPSPSFSPTSTLPSLTPVPTLATPTEIPTETPTPVPTPTHTPVPTIGGPSAPPGNATGAAPT